MRFRQLRIPAFGPFTNFSLDFESPSSGYDFQIIYGPNEAGKSSMLRAITALLYGIPTQTDDDFQHSYNKMVLAAEIENRAGNTLSFQRFKGRKNTLRDERGVAIDESHLKSFLAEVEQSQFATMFGLGTDELRKGARSLLQGEGDLGRALFATSLGGSVVLPVLEKLEAQAATYFRRQARQVSIKTAAVEYKRQSASAREHIVRAEDWKTLQVTLAEKSEEVRNLESRRAQIISQLDWIGRCQDAAPTVVERTACLAEFNSLPQLPSLSDDFAARARHAREQAELAENNLQLESARVVRLREQLASCATAPAILNETQALEDLHTQLAEYQSRSKKLREYEQELASLEPQLRSTMQELGLPLAITDLAKTRFDTAQRLRCEESAENLVALQQQLEKLSRDIAELVLLQEQDRHSLAALLSADTRSLQTALQQAAEVRPQYRRLPEMIAAVAKLKLQLQRQRTTLSFLWSAPALDQVVDLPVPGAAVVRKFRDEFETLKRDRSAIKVQGEALANRRSSAMRDLQSLKTGGELATLSQLREARARRDDGFKAILAAWRSAESNTELDLGVPLEKAYPRAVAHADELADTLRLAADKIARAEQLRSEVNHADAQLREFNQREVALNRREASLQSDWLEAWRACALQPGNPIEMEEWREQWLALREAVLNMDQSELDIKAEQTAVDGAQQRLRRALSSMNILAGDVSVALQSVAVDVEEADFEVLLAVATELLRQLEVSAGQRGEIKNRLDRQHTRLQTLELQQQQLRNDVQQAKQQWQNSCTDVGLASNLSPKAGLALLSARTRLLSDYDHWQKLTIEVRTAREFIAAFESNVERQSTRLAVVGESVLAREGALWSALANARRADDQQRNYVEQLAHAEQNLQHCKVVALQNAEKLNHIKGLAHLAVTDELEPVLALLERRNSLRQQLDVQLRALSGLARGKEVIEFIQQIQMEDMHSFVAKQEQLAYDHDQVEEQLQSARDAVGSLHREMQTLEASDDSAAFHHQRAETIAAGIAADAVKYMQLKVSTHFLKREIERYREQHQAPLLEASSAIFKAITLGSFESLATDYANDEPLLVGERASGARVPIEGMSEGSRDQLYLSLRLAAFLHHMRAHEPMPLILDDLLITFDDGRSRAILQQLLELSRQTQVFLFTHHQHLVKLCRQVHGELPLALHELD